MQGLRADDSSHTGSVLQDLTYSINDAPVLMPQTLILLKKFPEELSHLETVNSYDSAYQLLVRQKWFYVTCLGLQSPRLEMWDNYEVVKCLLL